MFYEIRFEVTAGLYADFFNYLIDSEIIILHVRPTTFGFSAVCSAKDYKKIALAARKYQCRTKVIEKNGGYFKVRNYIERKGLAVGFVCFMLLSYVFTFFIWRIDINTQDPKLKNEIASLLYEQEIYTGSLYSKEALEKATQYIYLKNDEVAYVALNFYKGVLKCEVDARRKKEEYLKTQTTSDILASQDGVITKLRVYSGFSTVILNQSVAKGDILVSATTLTLDQKPFTVMPRAYIEAYGQKEYSVFVPYNKIQEVYTGEILQQKSIKFIGKTYIYQDVDTTQWSAFTKSTQINYFSFFGFKLPVTQEVKSFNRLETKELLQDEKQAENCAKSQIQVIIRSDPCLIKEEAREYFTTAESGGIQVKCVVKGYYDITK